MKIELNCFIVYGQRFSRSGKLLEIYFVEERVARVAKFHASSCVFFRQREAEKARETIEENNKSIKDFMRSNMKEKWLKNSPLYGESIKEMKKVLREKEIVSIKKIALSSCEFDLS